jgi:hypothetical protein
MGLLNEKKILQNRIDEIEKQLCFFIVDGDLKNRVAHIDEYDGTLWYDSVKVNTKEESILICEWYLKTVKEL